MKLLKIDLENCYGIRKLQTQFDFTKANVYAIYAPNGSMKSSFAQVFKDVADSKESQDRVFGTRVTIRTIKDENGDDLSKEWVLVIPPYNEVLGHTEKTSTLLVDSKLRNEYEQLHIEIDKAKNQFLQAMKEQSSSKRNIEKEFSSTFTSTDNAFYRALFRIKEEVLSQQTAPFADINYDVLFDEKALSILDTKDFKTIIEEYVKKYNELLAASTYFKKGIFNYHNAATIAKNLADNGFFEAKHTLNLNASEKIEVTNQKQLESIIEKEKEGITNDKELRKKFGEIEKLLMKNTNARDFEAYISEHEDILPHLANIQNFKEEVWKSYIVTKIELYKDLVIKYQGSEKRQKEIEDEASKQRTQWEEVIDIFNRRFYVPFKLTANNRTSVILGQEPMLNLGFIFDDGVDTTPIEKSALLQTLSTGEKKALYILNIIFEIEARKKANQDTIFIIDDIADSFDYKNKYAIIEYLKEIAENACFNQIILTHNFDFFRTINSRFVSYQHCLMALRNCNQITLEQATGITEISQIASQFCLPRESLYLQPHFLWVCAPRQASLDFLPSRNPPSALLPALSSRHFTIELVKVRQLSLVSNSRIPFGYPDASTRSLSLYPPENRSKQLL